MQLSDSRCILGFVSGPPKKSDIIYEVPKAELPPSVRDLMAKAETRMKAAEEAAADLLGEPLEIDFSIKNNRVIFSMPGSAVAAPALAKSIIRAVQAYEVKAIEMPPRAHTSARVGEPVVKYERHVRIDWKQKTIFTNFPPNEGQAFLGAMAIVVEELQKTGSIPKPEAS